MTRKKQGMDVHQAGRCRGRCLACVIEAAFSVDARQCVHTSSTTWSLHGNMDMLHDSSTLLEALLWSTDMSLLAPALLKLLMRVAQAFPPAPVLLTLLIRDMRPERGMGANLNVLDRPIPSIS